LRQASLRPFLCPMRRKASAFCRQAAASIVRFACFRANSILLSAQRIVSAWFPKRDSSLQCTHTCAPGRSRTRSLQCIQCKCELVLRVVEPALQRCAAAQVHVRHARIRPVPDLLGQGQRPPVVISSFVIPLLFSSTFPNPLYGPISAASAPKSARNLHGAPNAASASAPAPGGTAQNRVVIDLGTLGLQAALLRERRRRRIVLLRVLVLPLQVVEHPHVGPHFHEQLLLAALLRQFERAPVQFRRFIVAADARIGGTEVLQCLGDLTVLPMTSPARRIAAS